MTATPPDNEAIFHAAREIADASGRREYVREACGGDESQIALIEALLAAADAPDSLLDRPPVGRVGNDDTRTGPSGPDADESIDFLSPSDKPGSIGRLGHYDVQEVVGRGGMGVVLKAFDERLHRVVAIKVMAAQLATSATARKRFTREARAAAAVTHDHVVTIHAVEDAGPLPHIVMQFVAGASLQDRLDRTGSLPLAEILRIGMQTASGLAAAHAQGLVHRDVKPANILLENGVERVKLTDFGLARAADDASLSQSGTVVGTPSFMSPEQAEGKAVDHRADLFSLGSVLYAMCTGRPPFRAGTSMGVLKRVCEETPRPIREANPEIPDWLDALIEKLHAKDPAARFQSAAEVAELLGRQLAQVQHPSMVPVPTVAKPADGPPAAVRGSHRGHRWAVAAAVIVATLAVLGTTEATGVTNVRGTVIRIFTPEGTLVVETDDPAVKVTVEGDGDLVITGAGPQEVRLRAGSYRLKATRDGKPVTLDRDLVNITQGDRQIVRVRLEGDNPAAIAPAAERGAFVVLTSNGVEFRKFDTLAEAVQSAGRGDTIEVRGNGPFVTGPIKLPAAALTIRAGEGYWPVIEAGPNAWDNNQWIWANGPLVLEGLEFRGGKIGPQTNIHALKVEYKSPLFVAHCRFVYLPRRVAAIHAGRSTNCEIRNCEFVLGSIGNHAVAWHTGRDHRLTFDGCIVAGRGLNLILGYGGAPAEPCSVEFTRNTITGPHSINLTRHSDIAAQGQPLSLRFADNVFDCPKFMNLRDSPDVPPLAPAAALAFVKQLVAYQEQRNIHSRGGSLLEYSGKERTAPAPDDGTVKDLEAWQRFWGQQAATSRTGSMHFEGGAAVADANLISNSKEVTPAHFRLRPDSAGYRAGKDGKDLGADVDLVGPGKAYERWKKTPDYQQWLKNTGQLLAAIPKPERGAFVLLGGKGVAERKFDTLSEAVLGASAGDTIEVRGNGPFVTGPIKLPAFALTIRAGEGYRPVIEAGPDAWDGDRWILAHGPLVLEGLEFRGGKIGPQKDSGALKVENSSPLSVAHCRFVFLMPRVHSIRAGHSTNCEIRHCEFVLGSIGYGAVAWIPGRDHRLTVDGCIVAGRGLNLTLGYRGAPAEPCSVEFTRNTITGPRAISLARYSDIAAQGQPLSLRVADNVFDCPTFMILRDSPDVPPLAPAAALAFVKQLVAYQEQRNIHSEGGRLLEYVGRKAASPDDGTAKDLEAWQRFWGQQATTSRTGSIHFEGGAAVGYATLDLNSREVTPADFRLRPDSAGYRAGKDGKDLGADVDLVGPGKAYERWKKTPNHQQWLKNTGQAKK